MKSTNRCTQEFIRGMEIILSVQPDTTIAAEHDIFYCGSYLPEEFTQEQLNELEQLGWFENCDSWATHV